MANNTLLDVRTLPFYNLLKGYPTYIRINADVAKVLLERFDRHEIATFLHWNDTRAPEGDELIGIKSGHYMTVALDGRESELSAKQAEKLEYIRAGYDEDYCWK